jgi:hypothetical protein
LKLQGYILQPYFQPDFPNKTTLVAKKQKNTDLITLLKSLFVKGVNNTVIRLVYYCLVATKVVQSEKSG